MDAKTKHKNNFNIGPTFVFSEPKYVISVEAKVPFFQLILLFRGV